MKKVSFFPKHKVDLSNFIFVFWIKKNTLIPLFIIIFSVLNIFFINKPNKFENSIIIRPSKDTNLIKVNTLMTSSEINKTELEKNFFFKNFIKDIIDYDEVESIIKEKYINSEIVNLSNIRQDDKNLNFKKIFKLERLENYLPDTIEANYKIKFIWHDPKEAKSIIADIMNLVSFNFEKSLINDLKQNLKQKEIVFNFQKSMKIVDLLNQASIARKLNIKENLYPHNKFNAFNYSLKGYELIEKEIEVVRENKFTKIFLEKEIDGIKSYNLAWVDYNLNEMIVKNLRDYKFILIKSILIALIIPIFYVIINMLFFPERTTKKN